MLDNDLGFAHEDSLRRWTRSAIECYKIGCVCSKCYIPKLLESLKKCNMKPYVLESVKIFGKPDEKRLREDNGNGGLAFNQKAKSNYGFDVRGYGERRNR